MCASVSVCVAAGSVTLERRDACVCAADGSVFEFPE